MGKRLSEDVLRLMATHNEDLSTRAMANELLELRAFVREVMALADVIETEVCEFAPDTKLADAIATERARMEGNDAG